VRTRRQISKRALGFDDGNVFIRIESGHLVFREGDEAPTHIRQNVRQEVTNDREMLTVGLTVESSQNRCDAGVLEDCERIITDGSRHLQAQHRKRFDERRCSASS